MCDEYGCYKGWCPTKSSEKKSKPQLTVGWERTPGTFESNPKGVPKKEGSNLSIFSIENPYIHQKLNGTESKRTPFWKLLELLDSQV